MVKDMFLALLTFLVVGLAYLMFTAKIPEPAPLPDGGAPGPDMVAPDKKPIDPQLVADKIPLVATLMAVDQPDALDFDLRLLVAQALAADSKSLIESARGHLDVAGYAETSLMLLPIQNSAKKP